MEEKPQLEIIDLRESIKELAIAIKKIAESMDIIIEHCDMRAERMRIQERERQDMLRKRK